MVVSAIGSELELSGPAVPETEEVLGVAFIPPLAGAALDCKALAQLSPFDVVRSAHAHMFVALEVRARARAG